MARRIESLFLNGPAGRLEALLEEPDDRSPVEAALVCHPHPRHGGAMHNKVVYRVARGLRRAGAAVLRFNFRGVNLSAGEYDHGAGELEDARAALEYLRGRYPDLPFTLAGFSFGSRIALRLACSGVSPRRAIAVGYPTVYKDHAWLVACPLPKFFVQSTHDEFGPVPDLEVLFARLAEPKQLTLIDAGNHFFSGALDELEDAIFRL
ncbi:MAG: alpha/beta fold hydrolase [Bryobacteraceae bacterium]